MDSFLKFTKKKVCEPLYNYILGSYLVKQLLLAQEFLPNSKCNRKESCIMMHTL